MTKKPPTKIKSTKNNKAQRNRTRDIKRQWNITKVKEYIKQQNT